MLKIRPHAQSGADSPQCTYLLHPLCYSHAYIDENRYCYYKYHYRRNHKHKVIAYADSLRQHSCYLVGGGKRDADLVLGRIFNLIARRCRRNCSLSARSSEKIILVKESLFEIPL